LISQFLLLPYMQLADKANLREVLAHAARLGFYDQLANIFGYLNLRLSFFLLSRHSGDAALGVYSNAVSIAESIWLISNSFAMVQYARVANSDDEERNRDLTIRFARV